MAGLGVLAVTAVASGTPAARTEAGLPRALLLPSAVQGRGAGKVAEWDTRIDARLTALGVVVVPFRPTEEELRCASSDCLERMRQRHGVDMALRARIDAEPLGVKVRLLMVRAGEARNSVDQAECADCNVDAAARRLDELIARALGATPGISTPMAASLSGGGGGEVGEIRPLVVPQPAAGETDERPRWLTATEVVLGAAIAGGLLAAGFGVRFLYDDGRQACALVPPATQCPRVIDTLGLGAGLLAAGAVLAIGGAVGIGVLEVRYGRGKAGRAALAPAVAPGGAMGLSLGGVW